MRSRVEKRVTEQSTAMALWNEAIEEFRRSLDVWLSLLSEAPDDPTLLTELADVLDVSPAWLMYGATAMDRTS